VIGKIFLNESPLEKACLFTMKAKHRIQQSPAKSQSAKSQDILFDYHYNKPGTMPGFITIDQNANPTEIFLINYNQQQAVRVNNLLPRDCLKYLNEESISWIDVVGLGHEDTLREIAEIFKLHPLTLEDIVNIPQRPKVEEYEEYLLIIVQMAVLNKEGTGFFLEQVSLVLGKNYLLTIQEEGDYDSFHSVRDRIKLNRGLIRKQAADYLAYAIWDAIIDGYFPVLESYGERIEELENEIIVNPTERTLTQIYQLRQELLSLRRAIWPQRDILNNILRDENNLISSQINVYLRDCYDHVVQIIDVIENYRDFANGLMDFYISSVGNKMNEIMKTLTVISTIFIPLTFIAGIYGMNFNPDKSPWNMPELNWYWGYPLCLALMALIAGSLIYFFWRRGWFKDFSSSKKG
jgi:magnesium transporter